MIEYLFIGLGGALGAMSRSLIGSILPTVLFSNFPLRIIAVNIIGCFLMGIITEVFALYYSPGSNIQLFLTTGFLGGFTTFSSFALDVGLLTEKNLNVVAISYVASSVILGIAAFFIGAKIIRLI